MDRSMLLAAADHLWQSTLFAAAVGALTLLFRRNRASLRHALWLIASLKFLVPFSLLTAIGARFPLDPFWQSAPHGASDVAAPSGIAPPWLTMLDDVAAPLAPSQSNAAAVSVLAQPEASAGVDMGAIIGALWLLGTLAVLLFWCLRWIGVRRALRGATPIQRRHQKRSTASVPSSQSAPMIAPMSTPALASGCASTLTAAAFD